MSSSVNKSVKAVRALIYLLIIAALVVFDQITKYMAVVKLKGQEPYILIPDMLEFRYLENQGAAFSMLQNKQTVFYILTAVFLVAAVFMLRKIPKTRRFNPLIICLLVLCAGAIGNLIDRIIHRYVVDFIYFSVIDFPIFNVADIYVTLSVIFLIILVLFRYKDADFDFLRKKRKQEEEKVKEGDD